MSVFESFVQVELPKRPYTEADTGQENVLVRRGPGPRQHIGVPLADGQVLGSVNGVIQGVPFQTAQPVRTFKLTVDSALATWVITHNLNSEEVIIQAFDEAKYVLMPDSMQILDANTIIINFNTAQRGVARVIFLD